MSYSIPLFELNYDENEERAMLEVLRSRWISTGPRTAERLRVNPLGIYVNAINWSREMSQ